MLKKENILNVLQENTKVIDNLPITIEDNVLSDHHEFSNFCSTNTIAWKLITVGNPGWYFIRFKQSSGQEYSLEISSENQYNCFDTLLSKQKEFLSVGGPKYLSVILEAYRCFITGDKFDLQESEEDLKKLTKRLDEENPLLSWFSEFFFKHCDLDDEFGYKTFSFKMIPTQEGFAAVVMMEEMELADCEFEDVLIEELEGKIHCYKRGDNFFIRTHFDGLIKGLTIFKDWAEKHRDTWENIDWD